MKTRNDRRCTDLAIAHSRCVADKPNRTPVRDTEIVLDLSKAVARVADEHPDWSLDRLSKAESDYRSFFLETKHTVGGRFPGEDADEVWHAHILHTEDYMRDCDDHFGFYLHHRPKPTGESGQPCKSGDCCGDPPRR